MKKTNAACTPNATCHRPGASTPSNLNRRIKPNAKNGTQKWNENWAFHENVPWRFIFVLSSIFDLIFDSFSIENWNDNWNENWPKILTVSIPIVTLTVLLCGPRSPYDNNIRSITKTPILCISIFYWCMYISKRFSRFCTVELRNNDWHFLCTCTTCVLPTCSHCGSAGWITRQH